MIRTGQYEYQPGQGWKALRPLPAGSGSQQLTLIFGDRELLRRSAWMDDLSILSPDGQWIAASTAGEIADSSTRDASIIATVIRFEHTKFRIAAADVGNSPDSAEAGRRLGRMLRAPDLRYLLVLSDGQVVNGSELALGIASEVPPGVPITGGLAGDAARFEQTLVGYNESPQPGRIVAAGFYGEALHVGHGSMGGWDRFGPERLITRSDRNVLYELDGQNALELYKRYLGPYADELPGSALLFPLNVHAEGQEQPVTRTILNIDEARGAMIFAGDMPLHARAQLMRANFDQLIDGSESAARDSLQAFGPEAAQVAILISCVGRKLILGPRADEEVEVVRSMIGPEAAICGFYSYGELCPSGAGMPCELHNQTMTITTLREA